jgi:lipid-binding SYLF domain-containing protein
MSRTHSKALIGPVIFLIASMWSPIASFAEDDTPPDTGSSTDKDPQDIVDGAQVTFTDFINDPNMTWFHDHVKDAKGIFVVPQLVKAGFIFGGSGGSGVLLAQDPKTHTWSYPAFYTMGSGSFGLQAGVEAAQVVLLVMTQKGMDAMLSTKFQVGADASVAAGPVGAGAQAATADILQFSRSKGIFGGLTVEGSVIAIRDKWNNEYYGKQVLPTDILVLRKVKNAAADPLREAVAKALN